MLHGLYVSLHALLGAGAVPGLLVLEAPDHRAVPDHHPPQVLGYGLPRQGHDVSGPRRALASVLSRIVKYNRIPNIDLVFEK